MANIVHEHVVSSLHPWTLEMEGGRSFYLLFQVTKKRHGGSIGIYIDYFIMYIDVYLYVYIAMYLGMHVGMKALPPLSESRT